MSGYDQLVGRLRDVGGAACGCATSPATGVPAAAVGGERLAIIGSDPVAHALARRGRAAGWSVELVNLFEAPGRSGADALGLAEACSVAVSRSTIVLVTVPPTAHSALAVLLRGCAPSDGLVVLVPGQPGGALQLARALQHDGAGPTVAEASWAPLVEVGRGDSRRSVTIPAVPVAAVPADRAADVARRIAPLFPAEPAPSALWTSLHAPDLILRTVPSVLTAAPLRAGAPVTLGEVMSAPTARGTAEALDRERLATARAFRLDMPSLTEWLAASLGTSSASLLSSLGPLAELAVPDATDEYWVASLAPCGLVPLCALAERVGVATPTARGLVHVAEAMLGNDYMLGGRGAELMGLPDTDPVALAA